MDIQPAMTIANLLRLLLKLKVIDRTFLLDAVDQLQIRVYKEWQKRESDGVNRDI